jgi:hypothetical protein
MGNVPYSWRLDPAADSYPDGMTANKPGREPRLGIDIGKVIIDGPAHPGGGDTAFFRGDEAALLATPEVDDAVRVIERLVRVFGGQVWLVSKCGPVVQARTLRWLDGHDFYRRTGLSRENVRFCRTRPDKRIHCEELSLTHFVDDHPEVHEAIRGTVDRQYFFGRQSQPVPGYGIAAATWAQAGALISDSLAAYSLSQDGYPVCELDTSRRRALAMIGHHWEPAEGTCIDILVKPHGNPGTDNRHWLMEIHCGDGESFRVELGYPGLHGDFKGPQHGQTCRMEADVKHREAKWDLSDPALSWKAAHQHEADRFKQELNAKPLAD